MWSTKYDKCIVCKTTNYLHWASGICKSCHPRFSGKNFEYLLHDSLLLRRKPKTANTNPQPQKIHKVIYRGLQKKLTKEQLFDLYVIKQQSFGDIAKQFGYSRQSIFKLCRKYGIRLKSKSEARLQAYKQSKFPGASYRYVNEEFFSKWSIEMAYVLGFLFADGCLTRCVKFKSQNFYNLQITIMDLDLLNKIKTLMKSEHNILPRKNTCGKIIYGLTIGRMKITQDLLKLGLTPRKSLTAKFPDMPPEYVSHFIRGYFDGDGTICRQRMGWKVAIVSGSKDLIESIKQNLEKFAGVSEAKLHKHKDANAYILGYNSRDNIAKIFNLFYDEHTLKNELYLARKYKLFVEATQKPYRGKPIVLINLEENVFGEWVKQHLKHYNFGAYETTDLAKFLGITPRTIQRWMKGFYKPTETQLQRIKDYLLEKAN